MQTAELHRQQETNQFDIEHRRYCDTVTWLAEVLPGSMRTPFEYSFDGRELYAEDGGALGPIFDDAIKEAVSLPAYEQRRRPIEKGEYLDMLAMMRGELSNTMVVESDFPPELMHAREDVGGYNVKRKPTMLRVITKTARNTLLMYSQSLDGSNRQALEAIRSHLGFQTAQGELLGQRMHLELGEHEQEFLIDQLTGIYDRSLADQHGGNWRAGIQNGNHINTYDFACQQDDLVRAYLTSSNGFTGGTLDYNLAAAVRARYLGEDAASSVHMRTEYALPAVAGHVLALQEMQIAGAVARSQGIVVSGCGKTILANDISAKEQLEGSGMGNQADKRLPDDRLGSRYFICPNKNCKYENTRPKDKLIPMCKKCGTDVSCNEPMKTNGVFAQIIERSFGKSEEPKNNIAEEKAWLN